MWKISEVSFSKTLSQYMHEDAENNLSEHILSPGIRRSRECDEQETGGPSITRHSYVKCNFLV
jgi:hypothetical protein